MNMLTWRERPVAGVRHLDDLHDHLLTLVRKMRDISRATHSLPQIRRMAAELTLQARTYFCEQELLMEGAEYPGLDHHRRLHAEFTEGLLALQERLQVDQSSAFAEILRYELDWVAHHLERDDVLFTEWLRHPDAPATHPLRSDSVLSAESNL